MGTSAQTRNKDNRVKVTILFVVIAVVTFFHFFIPTKPHTYHVIHIVLRKLYFLPPVIAAAWFGLRGAAATTTIISIGFIIHTVLDWPGNYMEQANQLGELASFWVVGLVPGYLFDRQRALLESLAKANEETILALVSALDMRARNSRLHSQRVREYALLLANRLGMADEEKKAIGFGALLHEVGKVAIHDSMLSLLKRVGLPEKELKGMRSYPEEGYKLLKKIGFLRDAAEIVRSHQEHFDGSGYPRGLKGEEIPLGARLLLVADWFDTLVSGDSPVRYEEAAGIIQGMSGKELDPKLVRLFMEIDAGEWDRIRGRFKELPELE